MAKFIEILKDIRNTIYPSIISMYNNIVIYLKEANNAAQSAASSANFKGEYAEGIKTTIGESWLFGSNIYRVIASGTGSPSALPGNWMLVNTNAPLALENITALKAFAGISHRQDVLVLGYYTANDGGGGIFNYDATIDRATDNGGTIIDPTGSGIGSGCWVREKSDYITFHQFGAKGDGKIDGTGTDDSASIQNAVNCMIRSKTKLKSKAAFFISSKTIYLYPDRVYNPMPDIVSDSQIFIDISGSTINEDLTINTTPTGSIIDFRAAKVQGTRKEWVEKSTKSVSLGTGYKISNLIILTDVADDYAVFFEDSKWMRTKALTVFNNNVYGHGAAFHNGYFLNIEDTYIWGAWDNKLVEPNSQTVGLSIIAEKTEYGQVTIKNSSVSHFGNNVGINRQIYKPSNGSNLITGSWFKIYSIDIQSLQVSYSKLGLFLDEKTEAVNIQSLTGEAGYGTYLSANGQGVNVDNMRLSSCLVDGTTTTSYVKVNCSHFNLRGLWINSKHAKTVAIDILEKQLTRAVVDNVHCSFLYTGDNTGSHAVSVNSNGNSPATITKNISATWSGTGDHIVKSGDFGIELEGGQTSYINKNVVTRSNFKFEGYSSYYRQQLTTPSQTIIGTTNVIELWDYWPDIQTISGYSIGNPIIHIYIKNNNCTFKHALGNIYLRGLADKTVPAGDTISFLNADGRWSEL